MSIYLKTSLSRLAVEQGQQRVSQLGDVAISREGLAQTVNRIPIVEDRRAHYPDNFAQATNDQGSFLATTISGGYDAGIGAFLGLIPNDRQRLSIRLHFQGPDAQSLNQIRTEIVDVNLDDVKTSEDRNALSNTESVWWAAMSSVCDEGRISAEMFASQLAMAEALMVDPTERLNRAVGEIHRMVSGFEVKDGFAVVKTRKDANGNVVPQDGGAYGAYLAGHRVAVQEAYGLFFIGAVENLRDVMQGFVFGTERDDQGRTKSGWVNPDNNSYLKAANIQEAYQVLEHIKGKWGSLRS